MRRDHGIAKKKGDGRDEKREGRGRAESRTSIEYQQFIEEVRGLVNSSKVNNITIKEDC